MTGPPPAVAAVRAGAPVLVVSPHLDDAVLSCGALLAAAADPAAVTVVTLFTAAGPPPHTRAARTFLAQCCAQDARELFAARRREDAAVLDRLGVRHLYLGHPDALFRRRTDPAGRLPIPELSHRYPTFRFDIARGRVSRGDAPLLDALVAQLAHLREGAVRAPLGVGRHVDHLLARAAGERLGATFYADFPYTARLPPAAEATAAAGLARWTLPADPAVEEPLVAGDATQVDALFSGGVVPPWPETYYA